MAMDLTDAATKKNARRQREEEAAATAPLAQRTRWVENALELVEHRTTELVRMAEEVLATGNRTDPKWYEVCPEYAAGWTRHDVQVTAQGVDIEWREYCQWGGFNAQGMCLTAADLADPEEGARRQRLEHDRAIEDEKARRAHEAAQASEREVERRRRQYELDKLDFAPGGRLA